MMKTLVVRLQILFPVIIGILLVAIFSSSIQQTEDDRFVSYVAKPSAVTLQWKDDNGQILNSIQNLKTFVESKKKELLFATNGGMYDQEYAPIGLYVENGKQIKRLNKAEGPGNFHLKPNGVFYITNDNKAFVSATEKFDDKDVKFATQSGPMLLIDGNFHPAFKEGSSNLNLRNGVGILPNGDVIFAISKAPVNFYDFAKFFKSKNCKNALYLDGFVSRAYIPEKNWKQLDGNFGVMISVSR
jgi:uncharacterized protein YigE (DUF2233 family)